MALGDLDDTDKPTAARKQPMTAATELPPRGVAPAVATTRPGIVDGSAEHFRHEWASMQPTRMAAALVRRHVCVEPGCNSGVRFCDAFQSPEIELDCATCRAVMNMVRHLKPPRPAMPESACAVCRREAKLAFFEADENIGLVLVRLSRNSYGKMCRSCVHALFWKTQAVNAILGWWSITSLLLNPVHLVVNTLRYPGAVMRSGPPAKGPGIDFSFRLVDRTRSIRPLLIQQLEAGGDGQQAARDTVRQAGLHPTEANYLLRVAAHDEAMRQLAEHGMPLVDEDIRSIRGAYPRELWPRQKPSSLAA